MGTPEDETGKPIYEASRNEVLEKSSHVHYRVKTPQ